MRTVNYQDVIMARVVKRRKRAEREKLWGKFEVRFFLSAFAISTGCYALGVLFVVRAMGLTIFN